MGSQFSSGKIALAICDRCGQECKYKQLKALTVNFRVTGLLVCPKCWEPDHPQYAVGRYPVSDPQALRNPRPDMNPSGGSTQWGWAPVGGGDGRLTPNALVVQVAIGAAVVTT